jgi:hypothetical protein
MVRLLKIFVFFEHSLRCHFYVFGSYAVLRVWQLCWVTARMPAAALPPDNFEAGSG